MAQFAIRATSLPHCPAGRAILDLSSGIQSIKFGDFAGLQGHMASPSAREISPSLAINGRQSWHSQLAVTNLS
jgi:hypothetical protein